MKAVQVGLQMIWLVLRLRRTAPPRRGRLPAFTSTHATDRAPHERLPL
jgi:hypothetical protein